MTASPFCRACGARVEWHPTRDGAQMALDPDPHPQGSFYFGPGLRLFKGRHGLKPKMYRCHWDTCPKKGQEPRRPAFICERRGCDVEGRHLHCFRCGSTEHLANDCEEDS